MPSFCRHFTGPSHISMFTNKSISRLLSRFEINIERLEIDKSDFRLLQTVGISLLYNLDFASPRHNDDASDVLLHTKCVWPTFGLQPQRQPPSMNIFGRATARCRSIDQSLRLAARSGCTRGTIAYILLARKVMQRSGSGSQRGAPHQRTEGSMARALLRDEEKGLNWQFMDSRIA